MNVSVSVSFLMAALVTLTVVGLSVSVSYEIHTIYMVTGILYTRRSNYFEIFISG